MERTDSVSIVQSIRNPDTNYHPLPHLHCANLKIAVAIQLEKGRGRRNTLMPGFGGGEISQKPAHPITMLFSYYGMLRMSQFFFDMDIAATILK